MAERHYKEKVRGISEYIIIIILEVMFEPLSCAGDTRTGRPENKCQGYVDSAPYVRNIGFAMFHRTKICYCCNVS